MHTEPKEIQCQLLKLAMKMRMMSLISLSSLLTTAWLKNYLAMKASRYLLFGILLKMRIISITIQMLKDPTAVVGKIRIPRKLLSVRLLVRENPTVQATHHQVMVKRERKQRECTA